MKPLKLYRVESSDHAVMHIAARSGPQAAEIFATWEAAQGQIADCFSVELMATNDLSELQRKELDLLLAAAREGIALHHDDTGWSIDSEGLFSFDPTDEGER